MPIRSTPSRIAADIRKALSDQGITASELTYEVRISTPQLHRFMKGERELSLANVERLLDYLGWTIQKPAAKVSKKQASKKTRRAS